MNESYYYFCSGASIFTVSTVGVRGRRRMGKYVRKARSVRNMEVSHNSLAGVRTRARALALEKQTSKSIGNQSLTSSTFSKPCKGSGSKESEPHYMQLRSRRLEKIVRNHKVDKDSAGDRHNENKQEFAVSSSIVQHPDVVLPSCTRPYTEMRLLNAELLDMPARNSCSSRPDLTFLRVSIPTATDTEDGSHSRVNSPAQSSLHASDRNAPVAISTHVQASQHRGDSRMVRRYKYQELDSKASTDAEVMMMKNERDTSETVRPFGNVQREMEVGLCFGENPMISGPLGRERRQGPNTRSKKWEVTTDNPIHKLEVLGSTSRIGASTQIRCSSAALSRSTEFTFSAEIEAFFASAEQNERRRFIDRYNFDPLVEKPLKGRYLWIKE